MSRAHTYDEWKKEAFTMPISRRIIERQDRIYFGIFLLFALLLIQVYHLQRAQTLAQRLRAEVEQ